MLRLDQLPARRPARIAAIDWDRLPTSQARRMRELGFDEGVGIETLHHGPIRRDPIAIMPAIRFSIGLPWRPSTVR